jgi:Holliday junction resolvase
MGARSLRKGKVGEREAAAELRRLFGVEARRGRQFSGGADSPDVVTAIANVHIEVKRVEDFRLYRALDQAIGDAGSKVPVVMHRMNQRPWVAIVRLDDLPRLATQLYLTLAHNA